MSNIIPIQQQTAPLVAGALPAYMQAVAGQSSMGTFGDGFTGGRRVQLKGGQINFLAEDGKPMGVVQTAQGPVHFPQLVSSARIIIVAIAPENNTTFRTYYDSPYRDGDTSPPACWSADGVQPSPKSHKPQSHGCASCPKNVKGTSSTGKGKACGSRKRLAVVFPDDPELRVFTMDLSATALFGKSARKGEGYFTLNEYAKRLKQFNALWEGVITEVSFADGSNIGVRFSAVGYVPDDVFARIWAMRHAADTMKAIEVDFPEVKEEAEAVAPAYQTPAAPAYQAPADPKQSLLAHPAFQTTLAHLREWAMNPAVTPEMVRAEAAKYSVAI